MLVVVIMLLLSVWHDEPGVEKGRRGGDGESVENVLQFGCDFNAMNRLGLPASRRSESPCETDKHTLSHNGTTDRGTTRCR